MPRRALGDYPSNVTDEEWALCTPYLTLMREDAPQREYALRDVFNALRWFVRADCRRLGRDYERLSETLAGFHWLAPDFHVPFLSNAVDADKSGVPTSIPA